MKNELKVIHEQTVLGNDFKIYGDNENPLFLAKDVADWIEHSNSRMMLNSVDEDEKLCVNNPYALKGQQEQWFLTEDGLYEVLMQSRKPIAKSFKKEVKHILKTIRKTGSYVSQPTLPTNYKEALVALLGEVEKNEALALEVQTLQPKAQYMEEVLLSGDSLTITQIAKDLGMTGKELNAKLHALGIQYKQGKQWYLYEKYDGLGYTKAHTYNVEGRTPTMTKWTQKGRKFIIEKLGL